MTSDDYEPLDFPLGSFDDFIGYHKPKQPKPKLRGEREMPTIAELTGAFGKVLELVKGNDEVGETSYSQIAEKLPELAEIADMVSEALEDGFQFSDVVAFGKVVSPIMKLASKLGDLGGEAKKQFVVDAVWLTYKTLDGYPDGNANNINVPWLSGSVERRVERETITFCAEWAVNALYKDLKEKGDV